MRVRFAPSPTGALHIGSARTALYNWLFARAQGATYLLRIEDTDRERSTPENVEQIFDALRWLKLEPDEEPVFQTQRIERHREVIARLLDSGHAYRSGATTEDVKAYKEEHGSERGFRGPSESAGAIRPRRWHAGLQLRRGRRRPRHGDHARDPRGRPPLEHPQAAARVRGPGRARA